MKYIIRSIKYFFYFALLTTLIICALVMTGLAEGDIDTMFRGGSSAIWKMALFFVAIAAVYPKVGFITRRISTDKNWNDIRNETVSFMKERDYDLETEENGKITFRHRGTIDKLKRMYEDRITITAKEDGFEMEGLRKDVFRFAANLEYRMNPQQ